MATLILKVNTINNTTITSTRFNNVTVTPLDASQFGPGVTLINDTAIKTFEATIYTDVDRAVTVTTILFVLMP